MVKRFCNRPGVPAGQERWKTDIVDLTDPVAVAAVDARAPSRVTFVGSHGERIAITSLEPAIVRVQVRPGDGGGLSRTWAIADASGDVPYEGRDREDLGRFSCPPFEQEPDMAGTLPQPAEPGAVLNLRGSVLHLRVQLSPFAITWYGPSGYLAGDHPALGYQCLPDGRVAHYLSRDTRERYFGLGEVAGPLDHHGRRFRLEPRDTLGYDAERTDPLYKHFPFVITLRPDGTAYGLLYDNPSAAEFDFGQELHNYYGPYRYATFRWGDVDLYFIYGPSIREVVERLTWLTGRMPLPPRWSLGYLASSMEYTEAPDPGERLEAFARRLAEESIPCDLVHLSSGYCRTPDGQRHVFQWDRTRIPDPPALMRRLHEAGLRVAANIKPAVLTTHPRFQELESQGCLVRQAGGGSRVYLQGFWGGQGAHLDFTAEQARRWWGEQVERCLLDAGIDATWNDNNEYPLWTADAQVALGHPALALNPVQTLLMVKTSREAQLRHRPGVRPYVITRSASVGMQRYAQTWSGDNTTSWRTLRYNVPMGLNLALSGMANAGHDVGGFFGDEPDAELLVRWVQNGIFHPRFCIHSWNWSGRPTEPWTYPETTPIIREAIALRYRLLPYLYSLFWEAATEGHPIHRPLVYEFQEDERARGESFDFMLGPFLLVPLVAEPGMRARPVYFPGNVEWFDFFTGAVAGRGGEEHEIPVPLERPAVLAREGALVPVGKVVPHVGASPDDFRGVRVYPGRDEDGENSFVLYEDDGETLAYQQGAFALVTLRARWDRREVRVSASVRSPGGWRPAYGSVRWLLPPREARRLVVQGDETGRGVDPESGWPFVDVALQPEG
ncbi:glycoside hydrolase family 31 protein [Carboxydochorda subterranea]|uniref:Glycoside hydrolase family 31 protein n=1 Tax=Carboxydichorda subterranea TaxID=3109565 RepID=A0ABZ1BYP3_9FIRM|nr:glycoside hydrolase family 31 protein [Limnochorda sp. L945t]WRP17611.1 glycoside hydrolase family 31 protein [Limnochorda sp. L945t]